MNLQCYACGKKFRSMSAEAKHRHNFPALCTRNKRFANWVAENERATTEPQQNAVRQSDTQAAPAPLGWDVAG